MLEKEVTKVIFKVERTSDLFSKEKPIEECYLGKCIETEIRTVATFEEFKKRFNEDFMSEGFNHRELPYKEIARDFEIDCYLIDINTLDELMNIKNKYGDIVIFDYKYNYPVLELYDTYRE